ncbi:hypothetical protein SUGI_0480960 [Cryptomeria japonica]|nr:hypothetical protein SUGI_0480960 [Cryptomeria japonica]
MRIFGPAYHSLLCKHNGRAGIITVWLCLKIFLFQAIPEQPKFVASQGDGEGLPAEGHLRKDYPIIKCKKDALDARATNSNDSVPLKTSGPTPPAQSTPSGSINASDSQDRIVNPKVNGAELP